MKSPASCRAFSFLLRGAQVTMPGRLFRLSSVPASAAVPAAA
jgi:hypothetical protein